MCNPLGIFTYPKNLGRENNPDAYTLGNNQIHLRVWGIDPLG